MCAALHFSPLFSIVTTKTLQRCVIQIANYPSHRQSRLGSAVLAQAQPWAIGDPLHPGTSYTWKPAELLSPMSPIWFHTNATWCVRVVSTEHQDLLHTVTEVKATNGRLLILLRVNSEHCSAGPSLTLAGHFPLVSASHQPKSILVQLAASCSFLLCFSKSKVLSFPYNMLCIILPVHLSL